MKLESIQVMEVVFEECSLPENNQLVKFCPKTGDYQLIGYFSLDQLSIISFNGEKFGINQIQYWSNDIGQ